MLGYLKSHGDLHKPLDDLCLVDGTTESGVLFYFRVQIAAVAVEHDNVKIAVDLERLFVRDYVGVFELLEQLGFLLRRLLVAVRRFTQVDFFQHILDKN